MNARACLTLLLMGAWTAAFAQVTADDLTWDFEGGSLAGAETRGPNNVALQLRTDAGPPDLYGWYDFRVTQHAAGQTVTFSIVNPDGWTNEASRPVFTYDRVTWQRANETWVEGGELKFRHTFAQDSLELALVFPVPYSELLANLAVFAESPFCSLQIIGQSVHARAIPMLTVTDPSVPLDSKRVVWIISRQHPMETPPYFVLRAMVEYLTGAREPDLRYLLRRTVFCIVPLVNVDGAAEGLSRFNANGVNLNRNWTMDTTHTGEEPEVRSVHEAVQDWLAGGRRIDLFMDMHAAPDLYDFGYRLSEAYSSADYFADVSSCLAHLESNHPFQQMADWRDLDENYGTGLSVMSVYQQCGAPVLSSENSWTQRRNGQYITISSLEQEGAYYARTIEDYLFPTRFADLSGALRDTFAPGETACVKVFDPDENENLFLAETLSVTLYSPAVGDTESLWLLETAPDAGQFLAGISLSENASVPQDGDLSVQPGSIIRVVYQDNDFARDSSWTDALVVESAGARYPLRPPELFDVSIYPNPFNAAAAISFEIGSARDVRIAIYDITGREVDVPAEGRFARGRHVVTIDGSRLSSGVYVARVESGATVNRKFVVLR